MGLFDRLGQVASSKVPVCVGVRVGVRVAIGARGWCARLRLRGWNSVRVSVRASRGCEAGVRAALRSESSDLLGGQVRAEARHDPWQRHAAWVELEPQQVQADGRRARLQQVFEEAE